ncbi:MAG: alpha/beta hydrolase [Moraxellaceae bacterium]|nr:MAG: alpha/beta hydrolase [Moraxellaceae bacterium]
MSFQHWQANPAENYHGPKIALIHGLLAGSHMQRHLLQFLREAGYQDSSLYSNHQRPARIAIDLIAAAKAGRPIVLIGYSQGGSQVIKVAKILQQHGLACDLVVSLAAGGLGRLYPAQWGFNVRHIPANIKRYLNYFAAVDHLGTDRKYHHNLAVAPGFSTHVENIAYPPESKVDHLSIVRCYPLEQVIPEVRNLFLERLLNELQTLK